MRATESMRATLHLRSYMRSEVLAIEPQLHIRQQKYGRERDGRRGGEERGEEMDRGEYRERLMSC